MNLGIVLSSEYKYLVSKYPLHYNQYFGRGEVCFSLIFQNELAEFIFSIQYINTDQLIFVVARMQSRVIVML